MVLMHEQSGRFSFKSYELKNLEVGLRRRKLQQIGTSSEDHTIGICGF